MRERAKELAASFVQHEIVSKMTGYDLITPKKGAEYDRFTKLVESIHFGLDVKQVKFWNSDYEVVWSYDRSIVGKKFPDQPPLKKALHGEISTKIDTYKNEEGYERGLGQLLEMYIPIVFPGDKKIRVVVETYQGLSVLTNDIGRQKKDIWMLTGAGFGLLSILLFGIFKSGTDRIAAQTRTITQSEEKYRNLVQSARDAIITVDHEGRIIMFNRAAEMIFDRDAKTVLGNSVEVLIPEKFRDAHRTGMERFFLSGESTVEGATLDLTGLKSTGEEFYVEVSLSASMEGDKRIVAAILRDVTERKIIQDQLIESEKQAFVTIVASSIGHELNNILAGLRGYSQMLLERTYDKEYVRKCAEIFNVQTERLASHANNLLSIGKPREPVMVPVEINRIIENVTEMLTISGILKMYTIEKNYSDRLPKIQGDSYLLEQVIRNLEINAAHAMVSGGILKLSSRLSNEGSHVEFTVADTGHGIAEDRRQLIFLPFFTTKKNGKGTGLGMFIIEKIVEQHKGYINLDSHVGVGTAITIGLPVSSGEET
ncbi:MAG: PAS domain S-box protein [Deltaproteobacteria bacterium]|nr:PAS domain S-box protein [Deltaproteobacteria bacterium]